MAAPTPTKRGFVETSTPDLRFLDEETNETPSSSVPTTFAKMPSALRSALVSSPSTKVSPRALLQRSPRQREHEGCQEELDAVIRLETERRNAAFTEASFLYYESVRERHAHVTFERPGDLGFTLALSRDGVDGRSVITVDSVADSCEHRLTVGDELLRVYDCLIVQPSRDDFLNIVGRIRKALRPLKFTFARADSPRSSSSQDAAVDLVVNADSTRRLVTCAASQKKKKKKPVLEDDADDKSRTCSPSLCNNDVVLKEEDDVEKKALRSPADQRAAALRAARPFFAKDEAAKARKFRDLSRLRAEVWRAEAASRVHAGKHDDERPRLDDDEEACAVEAYPGAVVRLKSCHDVRQPWDEARVGVVASVEGSVATVRFSDAALNVTRAHHAAIAAADGVAQVWRGSATRLEVLRSDEEGAAPRINFEQLAEQARREAAARFPTSPPAHIFLAAPAEVRSSDDVRERLTRQVEQERRRRVRQSPAGTLRGSVFAAAPDEEDRAARERTKSQVVAAVEQERRRRLFWGSPKHTRGAFVEFFLARQVADDSPRHDSSPRSVATCQDDCTDDVAYLGRYLWKLMCAKDDELADAPFVRGHPPTTLILERELLDQRNRLLLSPPTS